MSFLHCLSTFRTIPQSFRPSLIGHTSESFPTSQGLHLGCVISLPNIFLYRRDQRGFSKWKNDWEEKNEEEKKFDDLSLKDLRLEDRILKDPEAYRRQAKQTWDNEFEETRREVEELPREMLSEAWGAHLTI